MKNQQKYDLFTKESLSLIGDIGSDCMREQLTIWALSDLKFKNNKSFISLLMLLSGDIHLHPGPSKICQTCNKSVRKGLPCIQCGSWVHKRCNGSHIITRKPTSKPEVKHGVDEIHPDYSRSGLKKRFTWSKPITARYFPYFQWVT